MKSATILLVAVTIFTLLETSNADDVIEITEPFRQLVYKSIDGCKEGLANAQNVVGDALPNATGDEKEALTDFNTWLYEYLTVIIDVLPKQMIAAMDSGLVSDLKQIKADNSRAIDEVEVYMVGFNNAMPAGDVKDKLNEAIFDQVLYNAKVVADLLEELLEDW